MEVDIVWRVDGVGVEKWAWGYIYEGERCSACCAVVAIVALIHVSKSNLFLQRMVGH